MPTDNEFNDFGPSTPELEAEVDRRMSEEIAKALVRKIAEERIEEFKPTGLLNQAGVIGAWTERLSAEESAQLIEAATAQVVNPRLAPTLHDLLIRHRALAQATALEITELEAEINQQYEQVDDLFAGVLAAIRRQRSAFIAARQLFRSGRSNTRFDDLKIWERQNPEFAALLKATDTGEMPKAQNGEIRITEDGTLKLPDGNGGYRHVAVKAGDTISLNLGGGW